MNWYKLAQTINHTYEVRTNYVERIENKIKFLQRKADRLGIPRMEISVSKPFIKNINKSEKQIQQDSRIGIKETTSPVEFVQITISGEPPKLPNWQFIGRIEHTPEGNIVSTSPDSSVPVPTEYRNSAPYCEHCNTNRARNDTFLVYNTTTQEFKQIGSSCLKDFLGHKDAKEYAQMWAEWSLIDTQLKEMQGNMDDDDEYGGGRGERFANVLSYLAAAVKVIKRFGFSSTTIKSTGEYNPDSTLSKVNYIMFPPNQNESAYNEWENFIQKNQLNIDDSDYTEAQSIIDWGKNLSEEKVSGSNYLQNLKVILSNDGVNPRHLGILVSAPVAKMKDEEREISYQKREEENKQSDFVGKVGDKILMSGTFEGSTSFNTSFGTSHAINLQDINKNKYTWFTQDIGSLIEFNLQKGSPIILFGTIKSHDDKFKGIKKTILTRCKIMSPDADKIDPSFYKPEEFIKQNKKKANLLIGF